MKIERHDNTPSRRGWFIVQPCLCCRDDLSVSSSLFLLHHLHGFGPRVPGNDNITDDMEVVEVEAEPAPGGRMPRQRLEDRSSNNAAAVWVSGPPSPWLDCRSGGLLFVPLFRSSTECWFCLLFRFCTFFE